MLKLRAATVARAREVEGPTQELEVIVGNDRRAAVADVGLVGACAEGDEVIVNVEARDLALGSGGFDVVHVNLTRGLGGEGTPGAKVMKLNYSSLQHAVLPVEEGDSAATSDPPRLDLPLGRPVAVTFLHGQLAPLAWAFDRAAPEARVGFVQTAGGALPGGLSRVVRDLRARGVLAGHVTAGPSYGGELEAVTTGGALHHGLVELGWDGAICGPGPGILGSASWLGHGGMVALESLHTALALACRALVVPRMSSGDPRPRHRGLSHHARTVLELVLEPVFVALPAGEPQPEGLDRHRWCVAEPDLEGYRASGLPARTMGRSLEEDELFFAAALAAGRVLGEMIGDR